MGWFDNPYSIPKLNKKIEKLISMEPGFRGLHVVDDHGLLYNQWAIAKWNKNNTTKNIVFAGGDTKICHAYIDGLLDGVSCKIL